MRGIRTCEYWMIHKVLRLQILNYHKSTHTRLDWMNHSPSHFQYSATTFCCSRGPSCFFPCLLNSSHDGSAFIPRLVMCKGNVCYTSFLEVTIFCNVWFKEIYYYYENYWLQITLMHRQTQLINWQTKSYTVLNPGLVISSLSPWNE